MPVLHDPGATSLMTLFFRLMAKTDHEHRLRVEPAGDTFRVWCEACSLAPFTIDPGDLAEPEAEEIADVLRGGSFAEAYKDRSFVHLYTRRGGYFERRREIADRRAEARKAAEREAFEASRPWGRRYNREVF